LILKLNHIIPFIFILLASWVIFAATPFFRFNGMYPQVDSQIIFLHGICGLMFLCLAVQLILNKYDLKNLNHPLITFPFLLAVIGIISSLLAKNFNTSLSGSPQIGQGVFWYFDLTIMLILFSQVAHLRIFRILFFINLMTITFIVSLFTFFPFWNGLPISFYHFYDYLCFYGVLNFILFTTFTKKFYLNFLAFLLLGIYLSILDNRAAILFWVTTFIAGAIFYGFKNLNIFYKRSKFFNFLFSDSFFTFIIFLLSLIILLTSIYFWSSDYNLPKSIKGTLLDAPIVRGKIIENSLYGLNTLKSLFLGNGWGIVPSLLLENMNSWQYDELRLGYNLHFHTHNELAEHIISLGLFGGVLFLTFVYFIFKSSKHFSFESKLGWFLFFKITCFWFLWTGTLTLFAAVLSFFIISKNREAKFFTLFNTNTKMKNLALSIMFVLAGLFVFYGAYITYATAKTNSKLKYSKIIEKKNDDTFQNKKCIPFYNEFNRGGIVLDRYLQQYSSYLFLLEIEDIDENALYVLYQLQCKANEIIMNDNANSSLLNTSMQVDTKFYYKFKDTELGIKYFAVNYDNWAKKALLMSKNIPSRGDLIMPFLSYAVNNNKNNDAMNICKKSVKGLEAMCDLIKANQILNEENIGQQDIKNSINLIKKAINKGIFNELIYGFWFNQDSDKVFQNWGLKGIPLSPDMIFLISNKEKLELEGLIGLKN